MYKMMMVFKVFSPDFLVLISLSYANGRYIPSL